MTPSAIALPHRNTLYIMPLDFVPKPTQEELAMFEINFVAVFIAAIVGFILGSIWYSKFLFGNIWMRESKVVINTEKKGHTVMVYIIAFLLSLFAALAFSIFLGTETPLGVATLAGLLTGLGWVATSFGINYLFAQKSLKLFLIDAGYHTLQFTLYGIVLGLIG